MRVRKDLGAVSSKVSSWCTMDQHCLLAASQHQSHHSFPCTGHVFSGLGVRRLLLLRLFRLLWRKGLIALRLISAAGPLTGEEKYTNDNAGQICGSHVQPHLFAVYIAFVPGHLWSIPILLVQLLMKQTYRLF